MKYLTQNKTLFTATVYMLMPVCALAASIIVSYSTVSAAPAQPTSSVIATSQRPVVTYSNLIALPTQIFAADPPEADDTTGDIDGCTIIGGGNCSDPALSCDTQAGGECNLYDKYINPMIKIFSAFVGIAVTIGLSWGGIKYIMAGPDPSAVAQARKIIRNSLFALVIFILLWALINWLQPGGIG